MQPISPIATHRHDDRRGLSAARAAGVVERARQLQRGAREGTAQTALRGKNLGILCERDDAEGSALFRRAATALGARVASIRSDLSASSTPKDIQRTARTLGRLYDAVECQGMSLAVVREIEANAGVPVYDAIASRTHPTAGLAAQLDSATPLEERQLFVLQAVLLDSLL